MGVSAESVAAWLGEGEPAKSRTEYAAWTAHLAGIEPRPVEVELDPDTLRDGLGFHADDLEETLATRLDPDRDPELWWLLERARVDLLSEVGVVGDRDWGHPHLPARLGAKGRFFYVHVLLSSLEGARGYHRERGIPDDISWATFADLGRQLAIYRRINGVGGIDVQFWFGLHFRGLIYDLGRLQFNRARIDSPQPSAPFGPGDFVLGVHIPETGPMTPEACDESFARAKEFYATYFPDEPYRYATCNSWLLDDQLADYLPAESNIVRFLRRFTLIPGDGWDGDDAVFQFVFRMKSPRLEDMPRRTTLERAIVSHLENGGHWRGRIGWVEL